MAMQSRILLTLFCSAFPQKRLLKCCSTAGGEIINYLEKQPIGLLIVTESLDDMSGDHLIQQALTLRPSMATLLVVEDHSLAQQPIDGYRSNVIVASHDIGSSDQPLRLAVLSALGGTAYRSPSIHQAQGSASSHPTINFTPRERDLLGCYAKGLTIQEMGTALGITQGTAKTYSRNLLQKLGVGSRQKALLRAIEIGLFNRTF